MRWFKLLLVLLVCCQPDTSKQESAKPLYDYDVEQRLEELNISLPTPKLPPGVPIALAVRAGNMVYLSGNTPKDANGDRITGKVGKELSVEEGYDAARLAGINLLGALKTEIGDLNQVVQVVKVLGMVNATPAFTDHPKVINGCTDLMIEVFGERGKHARSAVGMGSLPFDAACEIEMIVQIQD